MSDLKLKKNKLEFELTDIQELSKTHLIFVFFILFTLLLFAVLSVYGALIITTILKSKVGLAIPFF